MSHIHWVARQNKLEIPRDTDEVNKREIHECDGRAHDPDTMVTPPTAKPTRKAEKPSPGRRRPKLGARKKKDVKNGYSADDIEYDFSNMQVGERGAGGCLRLRRLLAIMPERFKES